MATISFQVPHNLGEEMFLQTTSTAEYNSQYRENDYYKDNNEDASCPEDFICPLTLAIMNDPVMDRTGRSFERSAILEWMACGNFTCPLTRRSLHLHDLVTNHGLQLRIQTWRAEQKRKRKLGDDSCSSTDDETEEHEDDCEPNTTISVPTNNVNNNIITDFYDDDDSMAYALGMIQVGTSVNVEDLQWTLQRQYVEQQLYQQAQQGIRRYAVRDMEEGENQRNMSTSSRYPSMQNATNSSTRQQQNQHHRFVRVLKSIRTGRRGFFWNRRDGSQGTGQQQRR